MCIIEGKFKPNQQKMESSFLSAVVLPFSLALIMIGIGLELHLSDFKYLVTKPKPAIAGLLAQMVLLPLIGIAVGMYIFDFGNPYIGAGFIIITLAPGGVTSNLYTLLSKGDLALSVTLTAAVSIVTPIWMPFAASIVLNSIAETKAIELDFLKTFLELFIISIIPITIGMIINAKKHNWSLALRKPVKILSTIFLFLIIAALVAKNKEVLIDNAATVGVASFALVIFTFIGGYLVARLFATTPAQARTITFEVGIQNGTLALLITATILAIPEMTLAPVFYSLIMFVVGFVVLWMFNKFKSSADTELK
ncbi:MAG: bile acid:sodium symporter family protein [Bacteroidota bacterium]